MYFFNIELETLFLVSDLSILELIEKKELIHLENHYTTKQRRIYFDTKNLELFNKKISLCIRKFKNKKEGFFIKHKVLNSLENLNLKKEYSIQFSNENKENSLKKVKVYLNKVGNMKLKKLYSNIIIDSERRVYLLEKNNPRIYISLDTVSYKTMKNVNFHRAYFIEVEISESTIDQIKTLKYFEFTSYLKEKYSLRDIYPCKYRFGILERMKNEKKNN